MELGTQIIIEGGKLIEQNKVHCETGTNITVKKSFSSMFPLVEIFLKSNATEFKHIYDTFPKIEFELH